MYLPGTLLMWAAFLLGAASTVAYFQTARGQATWRSAARQTYVLMTLAVVGASALLMYLILTHDYRLAYVWGYSDNTLPLHYLISTFWAGQEGSFLLWVLCAALLGLPLMWFTRAYESRVMVFYNLTVLSLVMLLLKQDPFRFHEGLTAGRMPMDGQGLNPLLQNPWMVIHPPVMFVGYAALGVPFAFALAALWMRRYDEWTRASLPWVLVSLVTLGTGIMLGGYWAYETLGWGGYWGWDPVENASLVPWLFTAALTHGMLLQRGRARFRRINLVLAVMSYLLVVYATFLTRSGVLSNFSVHSFVDLGISGWLVFNILFFMLLSAVLLAWRWREIPQAEGTEPFLSRTVFFVIGIVLLVLIGAVVAIGTSAPLITRLFGDPSQVGPDFYNRMGYWLAVVFALFLGVTPFLGWSRAIEGAWGRFAGTVLVTAALAGTAYALGVTSPQAIAYVTAALFCTVSNVWVMVARAAAGKWRSAGGALAHVGMGLMLLAFLTTGWMDRDRKVRLTQDRPVEVLGYTMTFRGTEKPTPASRDAMVVEVTDPRGRNFVLKPKMWINRKSNQLVANPDIKSFLTTDLYLAPVEFDPGAEAPVSGRLVLEKDVPKAFRDWTLTFRRFDLSRQNAVPGAFTVGVVVDLERPGAEPATLEPSLVSTDGGAQAIAADIPGVTGGRLRVAGMSVDRGMVQVELLGLGGGVARTAVLGKGQTVTYRDMEITFREFDLSEFDPDAGKIDFGAVFVVERGDTSIEVTSTYRGTPDGGAAVSPAIVPGTGGVALELGRVDAESGRVELRIVDPKAPPAGVSPPSLVLDVSTKPLISLVWIGTILVIIGTVLAIGLRRKDLASIPLEG